MKFFRSNRSLFCVQFLASLFFSYHALAIFAYCIPDDTPFGNSIHRPFARYIWATANSQHWKVFDTIASRYDLDVAIQTIDSAGNEQMLEPLLPGFRKHDQHVRTHIFFLFMLDFMNSYEKYIDGYAGRICNRLVFDEGKDVKSISIVFREKLVRSLDEIRADGRIWYDHDFTMGPYRCS